MIFERILGVGARYASGNRKSRWNWSGSSGGSLKRIERPATSRPRTCVPTSSAWSGTRSWAQLESQNAWRRSPCCSTGSFTADRTRHRRSSLSSISIRRTRIHANSWNNHELYGGRVTRLNELVVISILFRPDAEAIHANEICPRLGQPKYLRYVEDCLLFLAGF